MFHLIFLMAKNFFTAFDDALILILLHIVPSVALERHTSHYTMLVTHSQQAQSTVSEVTREL
jgi:hypothetical protein